MVKLGKPLVDLGAYRESKNLEAHYEAELTRKFLQLGLVRNAAGKAFQAWKALLGALATEFMEDLKSCFKGKSCSWHI
jgi:hypothetical protein